MTPEGTPTGDEGGGGAVAHEASVSESQIAVHWREEEYYEPPAKFVEQANAADSAAALMLAFDVFAFAYCTEFSAFSVTKPELLLLPPPQDAASAASAMKINRERGRTCGRLADAGLVNPPRVVRCSS